MRKDLNPVQSRLASRMSELSEEAYCAAWMKGLEHALWRAIVDGPRQYGRLFIGDSVIRALRERSEACEGWIVFDEATEETFVPLDIWQHLYDPAKGE